jgi:hypothetical protein
MEDPKQLSNFLSNVSGGPVSQFQLGDSQTINVQPVKPDARDRQFTFQKEYIKKATDGGAVPKTDFGVAVASEDTFKYISDKADAELYGQYFAWLSRMVNSANPADRQWARQHVPELFEAQYEILKQQADLQTRLALININGPQNGDDMKLLFAYHNDLLPVSDKPLYKLNDKDAKFGNVKADSQAFSAGMFNPYRSFFITTKLKGFTSDGNDDKISIPSFSDVLGAQTEKRLGRGNLLTPVANMAFK